MSLLFIEEARKGIGDDDKLTFRISLVGLLML